MGSTNRPSIVWTFPVYAIGSNLLEGPNGELAITEKSKLVTETVSSVPHLAVFTTLDLAREYRQSLDMFTRYTACPLPREDFLVILENAPEHVTGILIDPRGEKHPGTSLRKAAVIEELESGSRPNR